ncbi:hypothetical protein VPH35_067960 [Triticum aestivum]|uniref:Mediator complex subunit 15 KIX domain-containing protein n=1 Tax=Triticum aestivum TaxID=4565 RepID=A0A3B6HXU3_WHEAT|nr:mediator of RNA polymerase II transcription subunit 15a-like [Triticum aestivum]
MDANWRPTQGPDPAAAAAVGDWRAQLQPEARSRVVNKILETLRKILPVSVPDELIELQEIARQFEDKIYTEATNQSDYVRKISLKMVSMETSRQLAPGNAQVIPNQNNSAPALPPQGGNQAQTSAIPLMSEQQSQQNQLNPVQQSVQSLLQQPQQTVGRQQRQAHPSIHQQPSLQSQQLNILLQQQQQQQQLMGHQPNLQQNGAVEMQEQQRLPVQSNNLLNVQQTQQMLNQQYMPLHQPHQLGSQAYMVSLQHQQLLGTVPNVSNMHRMHMLHTEAQQPQEQQHAQQPPMQPQSQHNQLQQSQQHLMSQFQSQPNQLQHQSGMQPQSSMQRRLQASGGMLLQQNNMDPIQAQRGLQEVSSSTSADSTAQTGDEDEDADYWQEEIYQMVKIMKDQYFADLSELFNKVCVKLQHVESMIRPPIPSEQYDRMKSFKTMLERILQMLQISKSIIQPAMRDRVPQYEKQIITILNCLRKPVQPQVQQ